MTTLAEPTGLSRPLPQGADALLFHLVAACLFAAPLAVWSGFVDWALGPRRFGILSAQVPLTLGVGLGLLTLLPCALVPLLRRRFAEVERSGDGRLRFRLLFLWETVWVEPSQVTAVWSTSAGVRLTTTEQSWFDRRFAPLLIPAADESELARALSWVEVEPSTAPGGGPLPTHARRLWLLVVLMVLAPLWTFLGPISAFKQMFYEVGVAIPDGTEYYMGWGVPWACAVLLFAVVLFARGRSPQRAIPALLLGLVAYAAWSLIMLFMPLTWMPDKL